MKFLWQQFEKERNVHTLDFNLPFDVQINVISTYFVLQKKFSHSAFISGVN